MQETQKAKPEKKVPERKCLGCGKSRPKNELVRIVRAPDASVSLDPGGKKSGRGAYVCKDVACLKKCRRSKRLEHSLGVTIPEEIYDAMEKELSEHE